ncbi:hypothetical protein IJT10_06475, partial [bacterium]|nr:hypothetical protein [bacterium]
MNLQKNFFKKTFLSTLACALVGMSCYCIVSDSLLPVEAAEAIWEQTEVPDTRGGLVVDPCLLSFNRLQSFFGWSSNKSVIKQPEFSFSVFEGEKDWTEIKAPFFGGNFAGVRKVAACKAKYSVGVIFQHNIVEQGPTAFEIMYTYSTDKGWSFSKPAVCDSYVADSSQGSDVEIAGVGGRKPAFCFGWIAENNMVKAALFDPAFKGDRPRACNLGRHATGCERIELAGEEKGGFVSVWNDGSGLESSYIKPLIGTNTEPVKIDKGRLGLNFSLCDNNGRNAMLVYDLPRLRKGENTRRQVRRWQDGQWQAVEAKAPAKGEAPLGACLESCQDQDGNLYVASLSKDGQSIYYSSLKDGRFSEPEVAMKLKPLIGCTGFS